MINRRAWNMKCLSPLVLLILWVSTGVSNEVFADSSAARKQYQELVLQLSKSSADKISTFPFYDLRRAFFDARIAETDSNLENLQKAFDEAIRSGDAQKTVTAAEALLEHNYTSSRTHVMLSFLYGNEGKMEKSKFHSLVSEGLFRSIVAKGDGKSPETAWTVFAVSEEYDTLKKLGRFGKVSQSAFSQKDRHYDKLDSLDPKTGDKKVYYFDVTNLFARYKEQLSGKAAVKR